MCAGRTWPLAQWRELLAAHPLAGHLVARLVRLASDGRDVPEPSAPDGSPARLRAFRPTEDGELLGADDVAVHLRRPTPAPDRCPGRGLTGIPVRLRGRAAVRPAVGPRPRPHRRSDDHPGRSRAAHRRPRAAQGGRVPRLRVRLDQVPVQRVLQGLSDPGPAQHHRLRRRRRLGRGRGDRHRRPEPAPRPPGGAPGAGSARPAGRVLCRLPRRDGCGCGCRRGVPLLNVRSAAWCARPVSGLSSP